MVEKNMNARLNKVKTVENIIIRETKYDISLSSVDVSGENLIVNGKTNFNGNAIFNNHLTVPDLSTNTLTISGETVENITSGFGVKTVL